MACPAVNNLTFRFPDHSLFALELAHTSPLAPAGKCLFVCAQADGLQVELLEVVQRHMVTCTLPFAGDAKVVAGSNVHLFEHMAPPQPYGMDNRRDPPYDTSFGGMGFGSR